MSTLDQRTATALLVIDVQNGLLPAAHDGEGVVARVAGLVDRARAGGTPVVWVQHGSDELPVGSESWQIVPALVPADDEARVDKTYGDAFEATDLEDVLAERGVGRLVVTGMQTDGCVRSTLHGAQVRGYDTALVSDAHTTEDLSPWGAPPPADVIAHTNLYWSFSSAPGRTTEVATADEVALA